jgi:hypothetical protein
MSLRGRGGLSNRASKMTAAGAERVVYGPAQATGHDPAVYRTFSAEYFYPTDSWTVLQQVLKTNGGSFGLYGPRGSGKSWLMHMAIDETARNAGLGLWFPCPTRFEPSEFLSMLSDNLANAVERHLERTRTILTTVGRARNVMASVVALLLFLALIIYAVDGITAQTKSHALEATAIFPFWVWLCLMILIFLVIVAAAVGLFVKSSQVGRLLREATSLRERIRFMESLKLGIDVGVNGGKVLNAMFRRSQERSLDERPTSVASLVFEFRNLAERITHALGASLVICIDELDKIEDSAEVRSLLRNIKGIFEVSGTYFLVSISEEAAASLQIATLQNGSRSELNSSFYSVIEMAPLTPDEAHHLIESRGVPHTERFARVLCLLAGGNRRELVRMAGQCAVHAHRFRTPLDELTITELLAQESAALLQEITRNLPQVASATADEDIKYRAWMALPRDAFSSLDKFTRLAGSAIKDYWEPSWANDEWGSVRESWRRLLIRLFVASRVMPAVGNQAGPCLLDDDSAVVGLRDILIMAMNDSGVARLMLSVSFGSDLTERYRPLATYGTRRLG